MLKIKDNVDLKELEKYGFNSYKFSRTITYWYRCFAYGNKVIVINMLRELLIQDWEKNDTRLHANPKCHFKDRTAVDEVLYDLINAGLVEKAPVNEHGKIQIETRGGVDHG